MSDTKQENINNIRPEDFKKLSYWEKWSLRRNAGIFYYAITYAIYTFVTYIAIKMGYLVYIKNFSFTLDWWSFPLSIGIGLGFWFIHEAIYKSKMSDAHKK